MRIAAWVVVTCAVFGIVVAVSAGDWSEALWAFAAGCWASSDLIQRNT